MNSEDQNTHLRENDSLVEPMYGGLDVAPKAKNGVPVLVFALVGFVLGLILLYVLLILG